MSVIDDVDRVLRQVDATLRTLTGPIRAALDFQNQAGARLLQTGIVGPPGVVLGDVLARLYIYTDPQTSGPTLSELLTAIDAVSTKLDSALELISAGHWGIIVQRVTTDGGYQTASAVWEYNLLTRVLTRPYSADEALGNAFGLAIQQGYPLRYPLSNTRWFYAEQFADMADEQPITQQYVTADFSAILPADTIGDWLNRTEVNYAPWAYDASRGQWTASVNTFPPTVPVTVVCTLTEPEFALLKLGLMPEQLQGPPVWPGLSGVTLGTPVALSGAVAIDQPMSGCIVEITSVRSGRWSHDFAGVMSWQKSVSLAFGDDDGDYEFPLVATMARTVVLPRSMAVAAHLRLTAYPDVVGTVTPFTIP